MAKITGRAAILLIHSAFKTPGADTPMKISAPSRASSKVPDLNSRLVTFAISK